MSTKSRESIYGSSVRHSAERAAEAGKEADRLACVAWNERMLGFKGPAQLGGLTTRRTPGHRFETGPVAPEKARQRGAKSG
jgi:hypothetical protein